MMDLQVEERAQTRIRNAKIEARQGVSEATLALASKHLDAVTAEVPLAIEWLQKGNQNPLGPYATVLRGLKPEVLALALLQPALDSVANASTVGDTDRSIAATILGEVISAFCTEEVKTKLVGNKRGSATDKVAFAVQAARRLGIKADRQAIGKVDLQLLGAWGRSVLLAALPDVFAMSEDANFLHLTEEAAAVRTALVDSVMSRNPVFLPMAVPPKPWGGLYGGGPLDGRHAGTQVMRTYHRPVKATVKAAALSGAMAPFFDALNALQSVPFAINAPVLSALKACLEAGVPVEGLPAQSMERPLGDPKDDAEKRKLRHERAKVYYYNAKQSSVDIGLRLALRTADLLVDLDRFYTPMNADFRGRVYSVTNFHFQREDRVRALFLFAEGEALGERGLYWLKVHTANCWAGPISATDGRKTDKVPFAERVTWTDTNLRRLVNLPKTYLTDLWWTQADSPFLFLAAAFELSAAYGDRLGPEGYVSRLPVSFDGSCSGIQHLSAMTRAKEGAYVNLLPGEAIQDVYAVVAEDVKAAVTADAEHEWPAGEEWKGELAKLCLAFGINRKVTKRNVMTFSYSSEEFGMAEQLQEDLMDSLSDEVTAGKRLEHPFGRFAWKNKGRAGSAAKYLAKLNYKAIRDRIHGPAGAMKFLQRVSDALAHEGKTVEWTTPLGMPWLNWYHERTVETVSLWLYTRGVRPRSRAMVSVSDTNEVDKKGCRQAVAPNLVHACDAAHLLRSSHRAVREGIAVATVHDSFGCLPSRADAFRRIILEEFVAMYTEHDPLAEVLARAHEQITDANRHRLPELPTKGSLDLSEVLKSDYAFA